MDLDTAVVMEEDLDGSNESMYLRLSERLCALSILDTYLKDSDSIFSHERKDELLTAIKVLLPDSEYAQRKAFAE